MVLALVGPEHQLPMSVEKAFGHLVSMRLNHLENDSGLSGGGAVGF
jgi:hypothetical protein